MGPAASASFFGLTVVVKAMMEMEMERGRREESKKGKRKEKLEMGSWGVGGFVGVNR